MNEFGQRPVTEVGGRTTYDSEGKMFLMGGTVGVDAGVHIIMATGRMDQSHCEAFMDGLPPVPGSVLFWINFHLWVWGSHR